MQMTMRGVDVELASTLILAPRAPDLCRSAMRNLAIYLGLLLFGTAVSTASEPILFKVKSKTTDREYRFETTSDFLKAIPQDLTVRDEQLYSIATAYARKYRGITRADSAMILEKRDSVDNGVPFIAVLFCILDKNRQAIMGEDCIVVFGGGAYLAPLISDR